MKFMHHIELCLLFKQGAFGSLLCQDIRRLIANYDAEPFKFNDTYWITPVCNDGNTILLRFFRIPQYYVVRLMHVIMMFLAGECKFSIVSPTSLLIRVQNYTNEWIKIIWYILSRVIPQARHIIKNEL